jgi:hypothetical protein
MRVGFNAQRGYHVQMSRSSLMAIKGRVTQVTKVFPKVTLKGRVFHPDSNDVHISSLR